LDSPFYSLLANRYFGLGAVSDLLAASIAFSHFGYCGGWGVGIIERNHHAAG
jgi:hypothetical protein